MKNRTVRLLCLLLALLTVCAAAVSCSGGKNPTETTTNKNDSATAATTGTEENPQVDYRSYLPTGDYDNEDCSIFMPNQTQDQFFVDDKVEKRTELEEAIVARNTAVEDRLNLALSFTVEPTHDIPKYVQVCMNSGSYGYDIIYSFSWFGLESQGGVCEPA